MLGEVAKRVVAVVEGWQDGDGHFRRDQLDIKQWYLLHQVPPRWLKQVVQRLHCRCQHPTLSSGTSSTDCTHFAS
jgi:hypothetical protein